MERVAELIAKKGYVVENIDATIIAQKPKMRPHIAEMEANIARALGISEEQVNVKATTEAGLGFTAFESSVAVADSEAGCSGCAGCRREATDVKGDDR